MTKTNLIVIETSNITVTAKQAADLLRSGGLIVAPTETRYGMLCRADNRDSLKRLYDTKGRPSFMPCSVFVNSMEQLSAWAVINKRAEKIAATFWPGSVTLVMESKADFPAPVISEGKIGIRFSPEPFLAELLQEIDFPVTATSANLSGKDELVGINDIAACFGDKIDLYLDGGDRTGETSTVLDITADPPKLLREGAIKFEKILEVLK